MPDLGPVVGALAGALAPAVKAMVKTTVGMMATAGVLAVAAFMVANNGSVTKGVLAAVLALAVGAVAGVMLAIKRAVFTAALTALRAHQVGRALVGLVFGRMLGVQEQEAHGQRGVAVARTAEQLPLAQAEARLRKAVGALMGEPSTDGGGWLRRRLEGFLLERVEALTLARFRQQQAEAGGVDLVLVRDELAAGVDVTLVEKLDSAMLRLTALVVLGTAVASLGTAGVLRSVPL